MNIEPQVWLSLGGDDVRAGSLYAQRRHLRDAYSGERAVEFLAALPEEFANPYDVGRRR